MAPGLLEGLPDRISAVFHLAASKHDWGISHEEYYRDNVEATDRLIRVLREKAVKRWFFYSSVSAEVIDSSPCTAYGDSKRDAEQLFHRLAADDPSANVTVLRPSVVFGPGNPRNTNVQRLIEAIHRRRFVMVGRGRVIKTTSYIENVIAATTFLFERMEPGIATYTFVDEPKLTTAELVRSIYRLLAMRQPRIWIPLIAAATIGYVGDFAASLLRRDLPVTSARITKFCTPTDFDGSAIRNLGFLPPVEIPDALRLTVEWYLSRSSAAHEIGTSDDRADEAHKDTR